MSLASCNVTLASLRFDIKNKNDIINKLNAENIALINQLSTANNTLNTTRASIDAKNTVIDNLNTDVNRYAQENSTLPRYVLFLFSSVQICTMTNVCKIVFLIRTKIEDVIVIKL
jgi:hypothetical protein